MQHSTLMRVVYCPGDFRQQAGQSTLAIADPSLFVDFRNSRIVATRARDRLVGDGKIPQPFSQVTARQQFHREIRSALVRSDFVRVKRGDEVLAETRCASLKRFTEDVREVQSGYECGISIDGFNDLKESDVIEFYHRERIN